MALQDLTMMLPSRLGCSVSLKTPNMGNTGCIPASIANSLRADGWSLDSTELASGQPQCYISDILP